MSLHPADPARPSVYLAGFDVFRPDALAHGEHLRQLCREYGLNGLYPLDGATFPSPTPQGAAGIYAANLALIRSADAVMANLNDFRGAGEPDSGTAFEVGFATALGIPVWGYLDDARALVQRVPLERSASGVGYCAGGYAVEDFGLPVNLMLACSATLVTGGPAACLQAIRHTLGLH